MDEGTDGMGSARRPAAMALLLEILFDAEQPMFIVCGADRSFFYNDAFIPIAGTKHPTSFGSPSREVWSEAWTEIGGMFDRVFAGEAVSMSGFKVALERSGRVEDAYFDFSYTPVRSPDGSVDGLFGVCMETTAKIADGRLALQSLERERDRIFEMSRDLFAVATFGGYLKSINPAWSRALGRSDRELLSLPFSEIIHPDDLAVTGEVVAALQQGQPVHQFLVRLLKADGTAISFAWSATPGEDGQDTFYTVGRDITEDQRREDAVRQAQKMEAVGHLTGGLAHDFNNLLQAVHGNLDLIRHRPTDPERVTRLAQNAMRAAERGTKLTAQLLAFSRSQRLQLGPTSLRSVLAGLEDPLRSSLGPGVVLQLAVGADDAVVVADRVQLELAIQNLAANSRDAMPEGGALTIDVSVQSMQGDPDLADGSFVRLRVTDEGAGMADAVAARAFDPFFTTKGVGQGTGLGLSQVYGMAVQAGGIARIERTSDRGTSVALFLKLAEETISSAPSSPDAGTSPRPSRTRRVLVIDDDPDVRQFLADSLSAMDVEAILAEDGPSGLAVMEKARPDVLVLDFAMPGMTGAEVANAVRAKRPDMPIIFASGYSDTAAIEAAVGRSAVLLRKPFRLGELEAALTAAFPVNG